MTAVSDVSILELRIQPVVQFMQAMVRAFRSVLELCGNLVSVFIREIVSTGAQKLIDVVLRVECCLR